MTNGTNGKHTKFLGVAVLLLTWLSSVVGAAWYVSAKNTEVQMTIEANGEQLVDHESRLRAVERIGANVEWIRDHLESGE